MRISFRDSDMTPSITVRQLHKTYRRGRRDTRALENVSINIQPGEMVALIGASGSGKSTLIRHIAGLVPGDARQGEGDIAVLGTNVQQAGRLSRRSRSERADTAVIFQQFNLVGRLTVLTNVCLGLLGRIPAYRGSIGLFNTAEKKQAMAALDKVGMADFAAQRASTLSGGQQQRVAVARTLVQQARVVLADEPVASLDPASATRVMETLSAVNAAGISVLVTLHQVSYAKRYCPRTIAMKSGRVVFDGSSGELTDERLQALYGDDEHGLDALFEPTENESARQPTLQYGPV